MNFPGMPFIAQLIYRIECNGLSTDQYEEQWRLVFADNEAEAIEKAKQIAAKDAAMLIDRHGRTIEWKLLALKDLQKICLENGSLLFSVIKEAELVPAPVWSA
jgi:hypothetical protein